MEYSLVSAALWIALGQIVMIDILLGGDNAVVIALACRKLPPEQRRLGILWGMVGAIGLRVVLIFFALQLLALPLLKAVGAVLLLWIGVKLLLASVTLAGAIRTIIVADAVMSVDNVIAVAGAAKGSMVLVVLGIVISIPIIVWGSRFVLHLMDRFPVVITLGAALLGWIAGDMLVTDISVASLLAGAPHWIGTASAATGAVLVVAVGKWMARQHGAPVRAARTIVVEPREPEA